MGFSNSRQACNKIAKQPDVIKLFCLNWSTDHCFCAAQLYRDIIHKELPAIFCRFFLPSYCVDALLVTTWPRKNTRLVVHTLKIGTNFMLPELKSTLILLILLNVHTHYIYKKKWNVKFHFFSSKFFTCTPNLNGAFNKIIYLPHRKELKIYFLSFLTYQNFF